MKRQQACQAPGEIVERISSMRRDVHFLHTTSDVRSCSCRCRMWYGTRMHARPRLAMVDHEAVCGYVSQELGKLSPERGSQGPCLRLLPQMT
jgi:hypothetical protein